jgi:hypothetical protein
MNQKAIIGGLIVLVIGLGGYIFFIGKSTPLPQSENTQSTTTEQGSVTPPIPQTSTTSSQQAFENSYFKLTLSNGWKAEPAMGNAVNITKGKYILYIAAHLGHPAGPVDDFSSVVRGSPSGDLVFKGEQYRGPSCGTGASVDVTSKLARSDRYIDASGKKDFESDGIGCDVPTNGSTVWFFSNITTVGDKDDLGYLGSECYLEGKNEEDVGCMNNNFALTMAYKATSINALPVRGSMELATMLQQMSDIAKTLRFKEPPKPDIYGAVNNATTWDVPSGGSNITITSCTDTVSYVERVYTTDIDFTPSNYPLPQSDAENLYGKIGKIATDAGWQQCNKLALRSTCSQEIANAGKCTLGQVLSEGEVTVYHKAGWTLNVAESHNPSNNTDYAFWTAFGYDPDGYSIVP